MLGLKGSITIYFTIGLFALISILAWYFYTTNQTVTAENNLLSTENMRISAANQELKKSVSYITSSMENNNRVLAEELKRRAAADVKIQRLQEEIKNALKDNGCAAAPVPDDITRQLRDYADRIRTAGDAERPDPRASAQ